MTPDDYAADFTSSLRVADATTARSLQSASGQVGISDLGFCQEYVRRLVTRSPRTDAPAGLSARVGNYVDEGIKRDRAAARPDLLHDVELSVLLPNQARVPGHADEIDVYEPAVIDFKTKDGLAAIRKGHASQQNRWQKHLYGAAAIQEGLVRPEGLTVRNLWLDRAGNDEEPHVEQEAFSWDVVEEASAWLDDVLDAVTHEHECRKDPPRNVCRKFCPFFTGCRGDEVELGPISNERLAAAVDLYTDASEQAKAAKEVMGALRPEVEQVTGRTQRSEITSTWINAKGGYWRVEASRV